MAVFKFSDGRIVVLGRCYRFDIGLVGSFEGLFWQEKGLFLLLKLWDE